MKTPDNKPTGASLDTAPAGAATDLARLGLPLLAYIRHVGENGVGGWVISTADGTAIGIAPDRATAFAAACQHDLEPVSVH